MIISASRRTDIPAFYAEWFMNRIRAGYCEVPNPFFPRQVTTVSLAPADVDCIVFWTRSPRPLFRHLAELDERGYHYYFQYTLIGNPEAIDPHSPRLEQALRDFQDLADLVGPERVIWRYDPIVFGSATGPAFHIEQYGHIARALKGCTRRSVISIMDSYQKIQARLRALGDQGIYLCHEADIPKRIEACLPSLVQIAQSEGLEITSCAEKYDLTGYGVRPGKCVDDEYIHRVFGIEVAAKKDAGQRKECGCVTSKDIGMYDSCLFGCAYCYATQNFERSAHNHGQNHFADSPAMLGRGKARDT